MAQNPSHARPILTYSPLKPQLLRIATTIKCYQYHTSYNTIDVNQYLPSFFFVVVLLQHDAVEQLPPVEYLHHQVIEVLLLEKVIQLHDVLVVHL